MSQCNVQAAVRYLEDLHAQQEAGGNPTAPYLLRDIYSPLVESMIAIRHASSFAGVGNINIHKPYEEYLLESPRSKKQKGQKEQKKQASTNTPPKTEAIAGLELGKVHTMPVGQFMDVIDQIAAHIDSNRNLSTPSSDVQENLKVFSDVIRRYTAGTNRQINIKLVPHIDTGKVERQPLGTYNRKTDTITIAVSPDGAKVSPYALHVPAAKVILHELVHQLTVDTLANNPELTAKVVKLMDYTKKMYVKKYGKEPEYAPGTATYGLTHPAEFVAEAYTSIEMQRMLADIAPTKYKTILQRAKDIFKEIIGIAKKGDPDSYTLLEEALEVVDRIMVVSTEGTSHEPLPTDTDEDVVKVVVGSDETLDTLVQQDSFGSLFSDEVADLKQGQLTRKINRIKEEQAGRKALLEDGSLLKAKAQSVGESIESMRGIAQSNYDNNSHRLAYYEAYLPKAPKENKIVFGASSESAVSDSDTTATTNNGADSANLEVSTVIDHYTISGSMRTNEGQTNAINSIMAWYKTAKGGDSFLLQGRGGTGKTTVINVLLRELGVSPSQVAFATPTNKAKKVIRKANKDSEYGGSSYYTVAQILSLKPKFDKDGNQTFETDPYADEVELPKALVVDEASMLHSANYDELMYKASQFGTKVIFMGDNAQLPPIGDPRAPIKSVVFDDNIDTSYALNQLMRQADGSPIISFTSRLIDIVNQIEEALSTGIPPQTIKNRLGLTTFDGNVYNQLDADGNGVVMTNEHFNDVLPSFLNDYKKNPKGTKYIGFNNHKHVNTVQKTNAIRNALYGEQAAQEMFIKGEPLMLNGPYITDLAADELEIFDNGEEFTVVSSKRRKLRLPYKVGKRILTTKEAIEVYEVEAVDNASGKAVTLRKPVGSDAEVRAFIEKEKENATANGVNPAGVYTLISTLGQDLSHGYIINSHRSQGSTYDTVYMDLGNIMGQSFSEGNDVIKSLYVAASRPRTRLVVMDSRSRGGAIVNPGKVQQPDDRPFAFGDVDIAEANDIIRKVDKCKGDS